MYLNTPLQRYIIPMLTLIYRKLDLKLRKNRFLICKKQEFQIENFKLQYDNTQNMPLRFSFFLHTHVGLYHVSMNSGTIGWWTICIGYSYR
jgi:hypothetical protein